MNIDFKLTSLIPSRSWNVRERNKQLIVPCLETRNFRYILTTHSKSKCLEVCKKIPKTHYRLEIIFGIYTRYQQIDFLVKGKLECQKDIHFKTQPWTNALPTELQKPLPLYFTGITIYTYILALKLTLKLIHLLYRCYR